MDFKEISRGGTDIVSGGIKDNIKSFPEKPSDDPRDIPCVRLNGEQVLEITSDDYALKLFYLTRIKPLSIDEIKAKEPEPEPGEASDVIQRFANVGLLEVLPDGKVYSKFPRNYVNFTDHQYDEEFESDKETRVFKFMKEKAGDKDFWRTNAYFSEEGYFTEEQTMHIKRCLQDIKFYVKKVIQENNNKGSVEGLKFRRHKFYDLILPLFVLVISTMVAFFPQASFAGNDPGIIGKPRGENWTFNPISAEELAQSIDWSKATFWQDYMKDGIIFDSNDPGRSVNASIFEQATVNLANGTAAAQFIRDYKNGTQFTFAPQAQCSIQLQNSYGDMKAVTLPCLGDVKFATESVCGAYGDPAYCDVAARASELIKIYLHE